MLCFYGNARTSIFLLWAQHFDCGSAVFTKDSGPPKHISSCVQYMYNGGPGSSVGIATDYGLGGPGSNPGGDEIFRPSRPALGPTQPPVKRAPGLSRG